MGLNKYVWLINGWFSKRWWMKGSSECTTLYGILQQTFVIKPAPKLTDNSLITDSGLVRRLVDLIVYVYIQSPTLML